MLLHVNCMGEALLVWKSDNDSNSPNLRPRTKTIKPCFSQSVIPYISSIAVQGLRFFGHWSLVFGPIACASLACQCAAAAAAHEAPPGWDCGRGPKHVVTVLLGSRSLVLGQSMDQFVQTTTCKKRSGNRSGKKPRTTNHQFRNRLKMWETCVFSFSNQKKSKRNKFHCKWIKKPKAEPVNSLDFSAPQPSTALGSVFRNALACTVRLVATKGPRS